MISNINTRIFLRGGAPQTHVLNSFPIIYKYFVFGSTTNPIKNLHRKIEKVVKWKKRI